MYSTGFGVIGVLIARASGRPSQAFLRERLFRGNMLSLLRRMPAGLAIGFGLTPVPDKMLMFPAR